MSGKTQPLHVLWRRYHARPGPATRNRLAEFYFPLVGRCAARMRRRLPASVCIDDLISVGSIALLACIESYKPDLHVPFSAYAYPRLWGAMLDEVRKTDFAPRGERQAREGAIRILADSDLSDEGSAIAEAPAPAAADAVAERESIRVRLQVLTPRERRIVHLRAIEGLFFHQIARRFKLTKARAQQIYRLAMGKLMDKP